ncbi:TIGR00366 family protein [Salinisphaera sp. T31B1]|uniref:short-chain fatty acid transporter n=1 Tax=Salinisphaera sp. T31B1 TaxID=727963 RepID=UPI00333FB66C
MLKRLAAFFSAFSRQFIPTPFAFAIMLTVLVFVFGIVLAGAGPLEMVDYWYDGFWGLLKFSMQMVAILLFGYVLAESPPVQRVIIRLAKLPNSAGTAVMLVCLLSVGVSFINWGLGLIIGAVSAREICLQAKLRGIRVHYPLAVAAGFAGATTSQGGLSSTTSLLVNTPDHFLSDQIGLIPLTQTVLSPLNLIVSAALLILLPWVCRRMHPTGDGIRAVSDKEIGVMRAASDSGRVDVADAPVDGGARSVGAAAVSTEVPPARHTFAERVENSRLLTLCIVALALGYIIKFFITNGFDLNLNIVNFTFLTLGLIAYGRPIAYVRAIDRGIKTCGQIVLQFPFYAGIMGMMAGSGLITLFAQGLVNISTVHTFPLMTTLSAAFVNLMVPSNGGQWAVQGPMLIEAARSVGADIPTTVLAFSYGDELTNGVQPMWMLPLLGVTALKARDILGYTALMMIVSTAIFTVSLLFIAPLFY